MATNTFSATRLFSITPNDSTVLAHQTRGIYVGGGGDIAIKDTHGNDVTFSAVLAGTILPVQTCVVLATGTTATAIVGLAD